VAQFNSNINLEVVVKSKQLKKLEDRLSKLNQFTLGGGRNKEFFDVKNAIAYEKTVDSVLTKLARIARFKTNQLPTFGPQRGGSQYRGPIGPGQASPAALRSSLARRRIELSQRGRSQYPTTIGPQPDFLARNKALKKEARLLRIIEDRTAKIDSQRAKRLKGQNSLTKGLLGLNKAVLEAARSEAQERGESVAKQRELNKELKKTQQYSKHSVPGRAPLSVVRSVVQAALEPKFSPAQSAESSTKPLQA